MKHDSFTLRSKRHKYTIYKTDCITGMREKLAKRSVDVVVTSPPYNLGIRYNRYDDSIPRRKYLDWLGDWAGTTKEVLSDKGSLFLNVGSKPSDPWVPFEVLVQGEGDKLQSLRQLDRSQCSALVQKGEQALVHALQTVKS